MKPMNVEIKKVVTKVKSAQEKFQEVLKNQSWVENARKYAEKQGQEVKKLLSADMNKVKAFLERERKELARFQKEVPGEVKKIKNILKSQSKELTKLLATVRKGTEKKPAAKKKTKAKTTGGKKKAAQSASSSSAS